MIEEEWNAEIGDEALLTSLEKVSLLERPNDPSSVFSPSIDSFGTDELVKTQHQSVSSLGRGRNLAAKGFREGSGEDATTQNRGFKGFGQGFQEQNTVDGASMQNRGFKGFRGGFGQGFQEGNGEDTISHNRGFKGFGQGFQEQSAVDGASMQNRGFKGFRGGFGRGENTKDGQRGVPQSGTLNFRERGTPADGAGFREGSGEDATTQNRGFEGFGQGFQEQNTVDGASMQNRGFKGFRGGFGQGFQEGNGEDTITQNRGFKGFGQGFQEQSAVDGASMQNRGFKGFRGGFGRGENTKDGQRGVPQSGTLNFRERGTPADGAGFREGSGEDATTQNRGFEGFGQGFQEQSAVDGASMQNRGFKGFRGGFGRGMKRGQGHVPGSGTPVSRERRALTGGAEPPANAKYLGCKTKTKGPKVTYVPPPPPDDEQAIFARYQTGINFDKYDENTVEVSGLNPPAALMSFADTSMCHTLTMNIVKAGFSKPTPVQKYSIPIILAGRDLMACAQTGSGKTAAFLVPVVAQMMRNGVTASSFKEQQEPECIITAPTRELVNQIFLEARKFVYGTCIRPVVIYGGTQTDYAIRQVKQGCNILCATPGRLLDIIGRGTIGLHNVKYLVLDEADRMLDMGFGADMKKLVSFPDMPPKDKRQTLMFSATFPEEVQRLAGEFLKTDFLFVVVGHVGGACNDVQQNILQVPPYFKRGKLIEILRSIGNERTLVFVDTKKKADFIACFLCQENIPATSIHGDRGQRGREIALQDFRSGKCPVLVATSVAARGLDIESVQHVINFDLPSTIEEYVHRIGRTGRCGNTGKAVGFFDNNLDGHLARPLIKVLSDAQQEVPVWLMEVAFEVEGGRRPVNTQKNYRGRGNVNAGKVKMECSARETESWD